jgi:hypothetical protein
MGVDSDKIEVAIASLGMSLAEAATLSSKELQYERLEFSALSVRGPPRDD